MNIAIMNGLFISGSDILVGKKIDVIFVQHEGSYFSRVIRARTCGCRLEVPNNYTTIQEFKEEFSSILNSQVWVMDIA